MINKFRNMDHQLFNAEEFAADESFINYYLKKDEKAVAYWTNWISRHPEKLDEVLTAERLLAITHLRPTVQEQEIAFSRFDDFLAAVADDERYVYHAEQRDHDNELDTYPDDVNEQLSTTRSFNWAFAAVAASIALMLTIGGLYFYKQPARIIKTEYLSIRNDDGKIKVITLADGTIVSLNANSTLSYPKHFEKDHRDVSLSGEAFFEVAKDKSRPFTVMANGTKTTVLGTKFNINAYTTQKTAVALVEGSVAFEAGIKSEKILLKPSEMVTYTKSSNHVQLTAFNTVQITAWKSGIIVFRHASFADISSKFKNTYGIELKDNTRSQDWNYSGQFNKTDYLTIIKSICFAKNLEYKQTNHTIIFTNK